MKKSWRRSRKSAPALQAQWETETSGLEKLAKIKAEIEQTKLAIEKAKRDYDLDKLAELQCGKLPALEKQLAAEEQKLIEKNSGGKRLIKEEVDEDDIAEVVARWTGFRSHACSKARCRSSRISRSICTNA